MSRHAPIPNEEIQAASDLIATSPRKAVYEMADDLAMAALSAVKRSTPASPAQLLAYTEKRIYRDAILTVSDADLQLHVFGNAHPGASSKEVGGDGE